MVSMHGNVVILPRSPEGTYVGGDLPQTGCGHRLESESSIVSYARQSTSSQMISVRRSALTELDATAAGALVSDIVVGQIRFGKGWRWKYNRGVGLGGVIGFPIRSRSAVEPEGLQICKQRVQSSPAPHRSGAGQSPVLLVGVAQENPTTDLLWSILLVRTSGQP